MDKGTSGRGKYKGLQVLFTLLIFSLTLFSQEKIFVEKIYFEGNNKVSYKKLKKILGIKEKSFLRKGEIILEIPKIENFYHSIGFLEAKVTGTRFLEKGGKYFVYYYIYEGNQKIIKGIEIEGQREFFPILKFPKTPLIWNDEVILNFENDLYLKYKKNGFPFFDFERKIFELPNDSIILIYEIKEGKRAKINDFSFQGLKRVKEKIALREIEIKKGDFFNIEKIENSVSNLYASGIFSKVEYEIIPKNDSSYVNILFKMEERKERILNIGAGYSTEGNLGTRISFSHLNLFRNGQRIFLETNLLQNFKFIKHFEIEGTYIEPFPFNFRIPFSLTGFYYKDKDEKVLRKGFESGLSRKITRYLQFHSKLNMQKVTEIFKEKVYLNSISFSLIFDDRNSFMEPTKGIFFLTNLLQAGSFLKGDADLRRILIDFSSFTQVKFFIFAFRLRFGSIFPYGRTDSVPLSEKFLLGGEGSVRGVKRFGIGEKDIRGIKSGNNFINLNFEARFKYFSPSLYPVIFVDSGILKNDIKDFNFKNFVNTSGFGLRFNFYYVILRTDYAFNLKQFKINKGFLYVGIGHMF
jgi:outer membrane protein assembly factor BamA